MSVKSYNSDIEGKTGKNINIDKNFQYPFHSQKLSEKNLLDEDKLDSKNNPYNESESSREDYLPLNEDLFREKTSTIKGILLAFIFFSVIIYSVLYMLTPEKAANLIFEGSYNSSLFEEEQNFYKLDTIIERRNMIIFNISLNKEINPEKLSIILMNYDTQLIINIIYNETTLKHLEKSIKNYKSYNANDFPFWLSLTNEKGDVFNITSDYLLYNLNFNKDSS